MRVRAVRWGDDCEMTFDITVVVVGFAIISTAPHVPTGHPVSCLPRSPLAAAPAHVHCKFDITCISGIER